MTLFTQKLDLILEKNSMASTVGHIGLDVAGLIPGVGEIADVSNALWYIKEDNYLMAALSLISALPELGDVLAKGIKYLGVAKLFGKYGPKLVKIWTTKIIPICLKVQKLKPWITAMDKAIKTAAKEASSKQLQHA